MQEVRRPFYYSAMALLALAILLELGAIGLIQRSPTSGDTQMATLNQGAIAAESWLSAAQREKLDLALANLTSEQFNSQVASSLGLRPPGLGILYLVLVDLIVLFGLSLSAANADFLPIKVNVDQSKLLTVIFHLGLALLSVIAFIGAVRFLIFLIVLFLSVPFGTLAYILGYGFFPRGAALVLLTFLTLLKIGAGTCVVLAHQKYLEQEYRGLRLRYYSALVATLGVSFFISLSPLLFVSIVDAALAIGIAILAAIWCVPALRALPALVHKGGQAQQPATAE